MGERVPRRRETAPSAESNHAGYLAVGTWHTLAVLGDAGLVDELWPTVRRGLDLVVRMQRADGAVSWALRPDGRPDDLALLTGNASLFQALRCGIALADLPAIRSRTGTWRSPSSERRCASDPTRSPTGPGTRWTGTTPC